VKAMHCLYEAHENKQGGKGCGRNMGRCEVIGAESGEHKRRDDRREEKVEKKVQEVKSRFFKELTEREKV
jgi:hypothetical protein